MFNIKIHPQKKTFIQFGSESLLEAALTAGISVNYGCTSGNCGLCKAKLLKGHIEKSRFSDYVIPEHEKNDRNFLMCAHRATTDLSIEVFQANSAKDIPQQSIKTKIKKIEKLNDSISILHIQTPRTQTLRFLAGQFVKLQFDKFATYLAIASCPCDERNLQFHIQHGEDEFAEHIDDKLRLASIIQLDGPMGDYILDDKIKNPRIFIAFESGFAPVKSLIEHSLSLDDNCPIKLILIHKGNTHYQHNLCRSWNDALENFVFYPIRSDDNQNDALNAITKLQHLKTNFTKSSIYIAGPNEFGNAMSSLLKQKNGSLGPIKIYGIEN